MSVSPGARLLRLAALVVVLAALHALFPALAWVVALVAASVAVVAVADLLALRRLPRVSIDRLVVDRAAIGVRSRIALRIGNASALDRNVDVLEELPPDIVPHEPSFAGVAVPAGSATCIEYEVCPRRRGDRVLGPTVAFEPSRLALWRRRTSFNEGQVLRVHPDVRHLRRAAALDPQRVLAAYGVKPVRPRGDGLEFESLRDYATGDDTRRIDWSASARRGRPVVRVHRDERHHTVLIALDASRLMAGLVGHQTKLDHAVDATLALAFTALDTGDRVGLAVFDRELRGYLAPRARRSGIGALVEMVRPIEPRLVEANYVALSRDLAARQRQRALLVILSDFVEATGDAVTAPLLVLGRRHRVLLVTLRDPIFAALGPGASDAGTDIVSSARKIVLHELLQEREAMLGALRRGGVQTLDLEPADVTPKVLNRYLAIRQTSR